MTQTLLERLTRDQDYPLVDSGGLDAFLSGGGDSVLFFAGDPARYPEALDVAVILPELVKAFGGRLRACLIAPGAEQPLQARFGFTEWPTLVFMRGSSYLGSISRVRDWSWYLAEIQCLLAGDVRRPPSVGIPVVEASS